MKHPLVLLLAGWGSLGWVAPALAHGAQIEYQPINGITIQARYDSGEPMRSAQVIIYAPDNPNDPWLTGTTDDTGRFVFTPDLSRSGHWEVMVRQAGHGNVVAIPVTEGEATSAPTDSPGRSSLPLGVGVAVVVAGLVGTALFFARGKR